MDYLDVIDRIHAQLRELCGKAGWRIISRPQLSRNSLIGMAALVRFTTDIGNSIF